MPNQPDTADQYLKIAVPTPLRRLFTYKTTTTSQPPQVGCRVWVPFGRRRLLAVIAEAASPNKPNGVKLKSIENLIDQQPLWPQELWAMLNWAAQYYQHALGDVLNTAMPALLRQGKAAEYPRQIFWSLTPPGQAVELDSLKRAPRQHGVMQALQQSELSDSSLREQFPGSSAVIKKLVEKQWLSRREHTGQPDLLQGQGESGPELNAEQAIAVDSITDSLGHYATYLLEGVTGSGKTEVYLNCIEACIRQGQQALVLIPEIGLTPQMIQRFSKRLNGRIGVLHSGLSDSERLQTWLAARSGELDVVLGTRSAIFTAMKNIGLIIVDEEHDASYKQQDSFRYSARDLAIWRASQNNSPIVLGSATPSLESLSNTERDRYTKLSLTQRAGNAKPPQLKVVDMRSQPIEEGLSHRLLQVMKGHLDKNQQVLLFLNRRGFSPTLMCHDCGWMAHCPRCETNMTYHHSDKRLRCHHCGSDRRAEHTCGSCQSENLLNVGTGTERIEAALQERFQDVEVIRIDRDTTRRKGSLEKLLNKVQLGKRQILIGTQMLAKGHHFPNVTMVGIIDADQGLHSPEFRAPERMAQLILQVAGRAGRAEQPGEVYIQTHHPDHPQVLTLIQSGYPEFARQLLAERKEVGLPPYTAMAIFRAEAVDRHSPQDFLQQVRDCLAQSANAQIQLYGAMPAPMEKRAGRFRAQLIVQASSRASLQAFLAGGLEQIENIKASKVRWSLDVDPIDTY